MANKSLTDLTARTATADSDLIHVNAGGTDYKQTKANFLADYVSEIEFGVSSALTTQVDALSFGSYGGAYTGRISSYSHQSETGVPENDNYNVEVAIFSSQNKRITLMSVSGDKTYTKTKLAGTWGEWILVPRRSEITSLNNSLANNGAIDGVRVVTLGGNFRYIRIKRESASTSFYGVGLAIIYSNERSCIFSIGPQTPNIKPLGTQTPTGTYSYSSGVNTAVIDLGASGQGVVILGGALGRSSNTTIELLASL